MYDTEKNDHGRVAMGYALCVFSYSLESTSVVVADYTSSHDALRLPSLLGKVDASSLAFSHGAREHGIDDHAVCLEDLLMIMILFFLITNHYHQIGFR
jgi:hypothetical protein